MTNTILETHCVFENGSLKEVAVLWDDNGEVRGTYSNTQPKGGYYSLKPTDTITPDLLQQVAGFGSYLSEEQKDRFFPGERNWSR